MGYIVGPFISVPAQNNSTWTQRTADISDYIGQNVRLVVLYQSGADYRGDIQLDDFNIGGNTFDPQSGKNGFQTQTVIDNSKLSNVNSIQSDYDAVSWQDILSEGSDHQASSGFFLRDSGGTPSGSTGNTAGNTGSYYFFAETSFDGTNNDIWLRSPEVVINNETLSVYTAQNGLYCGPIYFYLELNDAEPEKAVYGLGHYGNARYGEVPEFVRAPLDVSTTGAIYGSAVYGTNTYGGTITETHRGVSAAGSVNTVTVTAESFITLPSASATGSVTTASISADSNLTLDDVVARSNFNPEFGLTLDGELPSGQIDGSFTGRTQNIVFAGEVQLPSSITAAACLWEHGGAGIGSWLGVFLDPDDSNIPKLRFRAGEGDASVQDNSAGDIALQNVAISDIPEFDGNTHTVVFDIKPSAPGRIRLWIDGRQVINQETSGGASLEGGSWAGGDVGGWGQGFSSIAGVTNNTGGSNSYQTDAAWPGTIVSDLRYYAGELADFGVSLTLTADANVTLTGVQASGTADPDIVIEADATHTLTSVQGTSATGTVGTVGVAIHQVDGVQAIGQATTVTLSGDSNLTLPSTSATSQITTAEGRAGARGIVEGVEATGEITPVVAFTGVFVTFEVESVDATGFVTTATVDAEANATPESVQATGTVDDDLTFVGKANVVSESVDTTGTVTTATVAADANTTAPPVSAIGNVDPDVVIEADANHVITSVQGVGATGGIGDVVAEAGVDTVTGVSATIVADDVIISAQSVVTPESADSTGQTTTATISGDANFTPESADATGAVTTVDISIPKDVPVDGVQATGQVETVTLSGIANFELASVGATGNVDPDVVIEGDALHSITSVQGVTANGGIGDVVAEANIDSVDGVEATGEVTTATVQANAIAEPESAEATGTVDDVDVSTENVISVDFVTGTVTANTVTISGDANFEISSTEGTGQVATSDVAGNAGVEVTSVPLTPAVATAGTSTVVFDYLAQADNYSRKRTVYLPRAA